MQPNTITYNTLIDACHRAGDSDSALQALVHMKTWTRIRPDATTYTSLISTVARKSTKISGAKDPDVAFALMEDMISLHIQPNEMTYCALIDVCGRCRRSDLALKVLRIMIRRREKDHSVGAWTAAINACGKSGRIDTAIRLFDTMQKFGVQPNGITCGCLMDCLLRNSYPISTRNSTPVGLPARSYVGELLEILRFMKEEEIRPTEHMYTSLMRYAESMTMLENTIQGNRRRKNRKGEIIQSDIDIQLFPWNHGSQKEEDRSTRKKTYEFPHGSNKTIDLYTGLMLSLMSPSTNSSVISSNSKSTLIKVFLVFQQMRAAGTDPDLASYNALLGACSRAGDISRLFDVLKRIHNDGLIPDSTSWKEMVRGIGKSTDMNGIVETWKWAISYRGKQNGKEGTPWVPTMDAFEALISTFWKQATIETTTNEERKRLSQCILDFYLEAQGDEVGSMGLHNIHTNLIHSNRKVMSILVDVYKILGLYAPTPMQR
jgi:pentatricopeptide repeat protein